MEGLTIDITTHEAYPSRLAIQYHDDRQIAKCGISGVLFMKQ